MKGRLEAKGDCLLVCAAALLAGATPAGAATGTERITDGGFDQTPCSMTTGCVSPVWALHFFLRIRPGMGSSDAGGSYTQVDARPMPTSAPV